MRLSPTFQRIQAKRRPPKRERAVLTLAFVFAGVVTAAWVIVLFLAIRWVAGVLF